MLHNEHGRVSTAFWTANKARDQASLMSEVFLQPSRWYHLAATYDGASYRLYIDGAEAVYHVRKEPGSSAATPYSGTNRLYIGAAANRGGTFRNGFSGTIDEVRIYHRGLSAAEVETYYRQTAALLRGEGGDGSWSSGVERGPGRILDLRRGRGRGGGGFLGTAAIPLRLKGSFRWSQWSSGGALELGGQRLRGLRPRA